jgi:small subunit ribosomal protein S4
MSKRESAKYKLDRRMGENIWGRPKSPVNRREYGPGQHGQRRKSKLSDFGVQLRAKQKLKGYYGDISEKQFRKIYDEANRMKGDTPENLIGLWNRAWTPSSIAPSSSDDLRRPPVRQPRPCHGQRRRTNIGSYRCKPGDVIEVKEKSKQLVPSCSNRLAWLSATCPNMSKPTTTRWSATYTRVPNLSDVPYAGS